MLDIQLNHTDDIYRPGDLLEATVRWEFDRVPKPLAISVEWYTLGKGDMDLTKYHMDNWEIDAVGSRSFQLALPRGPLSLDGYLVSIHWQVIVQCRKPEAEAVRSFVLSVGSTPIRLQRVNPKAPA